MYKYQPLNRNEETRVLTIEPGKFGDDICCSLSHISLHDPPAYEALSYVWKSSSPVMAPAPDIEVIVGMVADHGSQFEKVPFGSLLHSPLHDFHPDARMTILRTYYAAGGLREPVNVMCDSMVVTIGGELHLALQHLRFEDKRRVLWVDALCINQDDFNERRKHVQLMGEIYARANTVLVWLGDTSGIDSRAFEALKVIGEKLVELRNEKNETQFKASFLSDKKIRGLHWNALSDLLNRAWFGRVWVIQEIANAGTAKIHISSLVYDWDDFATVINLLRMKDVDVLLYARGEVPAVPSIDLMLNLRRNRDDPKARPPLLDLLISSRHFKCTLPYDKIYGVLGLASDIAENHVEVDYSIDASKVYTDFAVSHLIKHKALDMLYACTKTIGESKLDLPSWVPDWTQPCHHTPFLFGGLDSHAAGDSEIQLRFESNNRSLFIHGKVIDTIEAVEQLRIIPRAGYIPGAIKAKSNIWGSSHNEWSNQHLDLSRKWFSNAINIAFPDKTCTPENFEALWRTFVCNKTLDGTTPPSSWGEYFSEFMYAIVTPVTEGTSHLKNKWIKETRDPYDLRERSGDEDHYMRRGEMSLGILNMTIGLWCKNRRFYRSVTGRFGLAPDQTQQGDEICVLYGGPVPFVLRPDGTGRHEIIGDCYLHGIMDGEAMTTSLVEQEFHLF